MNCFNLNQVAQGTCQAYIRGWIHHSKICNTKKTESVLQYKKNREHDDSDVPVFDNHRLNKYSRLGSEGKS